MALELSTGLRNGMLNSTGIKEALANGVIYVYSGPQPIDADSAVQGTLLGKITVDGGAFSFGTATNGLNFDAPSGNVVSKAAAETWKLIATTAGNAGWFRFMGNATDNLGASTTLPRIDGSIATTGADMNLSSTALAVGTPVTIDAFDLTFPAA